MFQVLTTLILATHFAYLAYVVVGGFLAWRWPSTIWLHLGAAGWGLVVVVTPLECPLTYAEHWSRHRAGQEGFDAGFIDRYIEGVLYPEQYTQLLQVVAGLLVVTSWVVLYLRWRSRQRTRRGTGGYAGSGAGRAS